MDKWIVILSGMCILLSIVVAVYSYRSSRRQTQRIRQMIDAAIEGRFRERQFDETALSQLESRLAEYLGSNEVAQGRLANERDKIKELISDISHQTKTPIANLLLYGELLREMDVPGEAQEYTAQLLKQVEKLQILIDDLVKMSRLETGILRLQPQCEAVQDMLDDICESYMPRAQAKGLTLRGLPSGTEVMASFDRKWTQEAVSNIVDNAVKYTNRGGVELSVREFEMFISIDIRDSGIGVPEDEQAEIFGRFYRGKNVRGQDGIGVGLYLAREIISGQGGYIKLSSNEQGSTFSVFLPKVQ